MARTNRAPALPDGIDDDDDGAEERRAELRTRVGGANIDPETLLATDYLNHFNEVVMLIGMLPDMPDCLEDIEIWAPKSYAAHFHDSGFQASELAIECYELSPPAYRAPFDLTVTHLDALVLGGVEPLRRAIADGDEAELGRLAEAISHRMRRLIDIAAAIIHGSDALGQGDIDQIMDN